MEMSWAAQPQIQRRGGSRIFGPAAASIRIRDSGAFILIFVLVLVLFYLLRRVLL